MLLQDFIAFLWIEFELKLQSKKSQFWATIDIFFSNVTLKFDR